MSHQPAAPVSGTTSTVGPSVRNLVPLVVFGGVTLLGVALAGLVGTTMGLLVGGVAGSVLAVTASLALFAVAPALAAVVARRLADSGRDVRAFSTNSSF